MDLRTALQAWQKKHMPKMKVTYSSVPAKATPPIMYTMMGSPIILTDNLTAALISQRGRFALGHSDVPLTFFKDEQKILKDHGERALRKYWAEGERPPRAPKSSKKQLEMQVSAAYTKLRTELLAA